MLQLEIPINDEGEIFRHPITRSVLSIGSDAENDVRIELRSISPFHAELTRDADGHCYLRDLDSAGGTLFNGRQLRGQVQVQAGDTFRLGDLDCAIAGEGVATSDAASPGVAAVTSAGIGSQAEEILRLLRAGQEELRQEINASRSEWIRTGESLKERLLERDLERERARIEEIKGEHEASIRNLDQAIAAREKETADLRERLNTANREAERLRGEMWRKDQVSLDELQSARAAWDAARADSEFLREQLAQASREEKRLRQDVARLRRTLQLSREGFSFFLHRSRLHLEESRAQHDALGAKQRETALRLAALADELEGVRSRADRDKSEWGTRFAAENRHRRQAEENANSLASELSAVRENANRERERLTGDFERRLSEETESRKRQETRARRAEEERDEIRERLTRDATTVADSLERKLKEEQRARKEAEEEVARLARELDRITTESREEMTTAAAAHSQRLQEETHARAAAQDSVRQLQKELTQFRRQVEDRQERIEELERRSQRLEEEKMTSDRQRRRDREKLAAARERSLAHARDLNRRITENFETRLRSETEAHRSAAEEAARWKDRTTEAERQLAEIRTRSLELEATLSRTLAEKDRLASDWESRYQERESEWETRHRVLEETWTGRFQSLEEDHRKLLGCCDDLAAFEALLAATRTDADACEERRHQLVDENRKLDREKHALVERINQLNTEHAMLHRVVREKRERNEEVTDRLHGIEAKLKEAESRVNHLRELEISLQRSVARTRGAALSRRGMYSEGAQIWPETEEAICRELIEPIVLLDQLIEAHRRRRILFSFGRRLERLRESFSALLENHSVDRFDLKPGTQVSAESRKLIHPINPKALEPTRVSRRRRRGQGGISISRTVRPGYVYRNGGNDVVIRKAEVIVG